MPLTRRAALLAFVLPLAACEDEEVDLGRPETPPAIYDAAITTPDAALPDAPATQAQLSPPPETR